MSVYVLLNVLNELRTRDKKKGLLRMLSLFIAKAQMSDYIHHLTLRLL